MRIIAYTRVSSQSQAEQGHSLEAQRAKLRAYADLYDHTVVETIEDAGYSAKTLQRPGLQRALEILRAKQAEGLLVLKLDRLTRSVKDLGSLLELGFGDGTYSLMAVEERIASETASGRLVLNVLVSVSQWEREATSERTTICLRHLRDQGVRLGGTPYGWARTELGPEGRLVWREHSQQRDVVREMLRLHDLGESYSGIARRLNEQGHRTQRGRSWTHRQVARSIRRAS